MTETTKPVLTKAEKFAKRIAVLTERITKDSAELESVQLEAQTAERLANVGVGTIIVARLGRAGSEAKPAVYEEDGVTVKTSAKEATQGTLRYVEAVVLGSKEDDSGSTRYKIEFGGGFDKDVEIIQASQIHEVKSGELQTSAIDTLMAQPGVNY